MLGERRTHQGDKFTGVDNCKALCEGDFPPEFSVVQESYDLLTFENQRLQVRNIDEYLFHDNPLARPVGRKVRPEKRFFTLMVIKAKVVPKQGPPRKIFDMV